MTDNLQTLTAHVVKTLPDSITQRGPILDALLELLPDSHPNYRELAEMKIHLEQHELLQSQLPVNLNQEEGHSEEIQDEEMVFRQDE